MTTNSTQPQNAPTHPLDDRDLLAAPDIVRRSRRTGNRLYLVTRYESGEEFHRTGYISRTGGWKRAYLVMSRSTQYASSDMLTAEDWAGDNPRTTVEGIQYRGSRHYVKPGTNERIKPGRDRYVFTN